MKDKSKKTIAFFIVTLIALLAAMCWGILELFGKFKSKEVSTTIPVTGNVSVPELKTAPELPITIIKYQTILKDAVLEDAFGKPL